MTDFWLPNESLAVRSLAIANAMAWCAQVPTGTSATERSAAVGDCVIFGALSSLLGKSNGGFSEGGFLQ